MSTTTEVKPLLSFHGDESIKEKYLERLRQHRIADEIVQGIGFEKGKGCAIGCTLNKYDHLAFEIELGIPRILAKLEDRIFEGLSVEDSKDFPINFLSAIPVGKDLKNVWKHLFIWMLVDPTEGVIKFAKTAQTKEAILAVAAKYKHSLEETITKEEWKIVRKNAAATAATAAAYAAAAAAYAAAATAAAYAADAAADAYAYAAAATAAAYAAARENYYKKMADKLIELVALA